MSDPETSMTKQRDTNKAPANTGAALEAEIDEIFGGPMEKEADTHAAPAEEPEDKD